MASQSKIKIYITDENIKYINKLKTTGSITNKINRIIEHHKTNNKKPL